MEGEKDIHTLDKPMETNMAEIEYKPDWANLPDLAFNEIMMIGVSLLTCMRVCSSWRDRITKNLLENPTKKNIIKARSERAMGSNMFPETKRKMWQLISDCIFEAHQRTCFLTREQIQLICSQGINEEEVEQFMDMVSALIICRTFVELFSCRPPRICGSMQPAE